MFTSSSTTLSSAAAAVAPCATKKMSNDWQFVADAGERQRCGHVWTMDYLAYETLEPVHAEWPCKRDGKYRNGNQWRCGLHTPGVGRKGPRRVPKDSTPPAGS